jgi:hypothetical protein
MTRQSDTGESANPRNAIDEPRHVTYAAKNRQGGKEFGGALILYAIVLTATLHYGQRLPRGALQTALYVSPMLPFGLAIWAVLRQIRRSDEYIRQSTLESVAIAAAATAGLTFTYGFLENAGFPKLSMFTVWPVMGAVWTMVSLGNYLRGR